MDLNTKNGFFLQSVRTLGLRGEGESPRSHTRAVTPGRSPRGAASMTVASSEASSDRASSPHRREAHSPDHSFVREHAEAERPPSPAREDPRSTAAKTKLQEQETALTILKRENELLLRSLRDFAGEVRLNPKTQSRMGAHRGGSPVRWRRTTRAGAAVRGALNPPFPPNAHGWLGLRSRIRSRTSPPQLSDLVAAMERDGRAALDLYTIEFGHERVGMIVCLDDLGQAFVGDLRDDEHGNPLAAKASGRVAVGDVVLAVNDTPLTHVRTLTMVSHVFATAARPVRVLFKRAPRHVEV